MVFKRTLEFSALIGFFLFFFSFFCFLFCFAFFPGSSLFHGVNPYRRLSERYSLVHRKSLISETMNEGHELTITSCMTTQHGKDNPEIMSCCSLQLCAHLQSC